MAETYHREHPEQPVIGTEETSYVISRGGVKTDLGNGLLSSAGDVTMPWGTTPKGFVKRFEKTPWLAGSFMWTGFDYRGEPNPFITTNVSSSFGTLDLTGMEKPPFWYYKEWWTDEPVLKLTPHRNHKVGKMVEKPYKVRLHYGKAHVFVKSRTPEKVKLTATLSLN